MTITGRTWMAGVRRGQKAPARMMVRRSDIDITGARPLPLGMPRIPSTHVTNSEPPGHPRTSRIWNTEVTDIGRQLRRANRFDEATGNVVDDVAGIQSSPAP